MLMVKTEKGCIKGRGRNVLVSARRFKTELKVLHVVVPVRSLTTALQQAEMAQAQFQIGCACVRVKVARSLSRPILVDSPRSNSSG